MFGYLFLFVLGSVAGWRLHKYHADIFSSLQTLEADLLDLVHSAHDRITALEEKLTPKK